MSQSRRGLDNRKIVNELLRSSNIISMYGSSNFMGMYGSLTESAGFKINEKLKENMMWFGCIWEYWKSACKNIRTVSLSSRLYAIQSEYFLKILEELTYNHLLLLLLLLLLLFVWIHIYNLCSSKIHTIKK